MGTQRLLGRRSSGPLYVDAFSEIENVPKIMNSPPDRPTDLLFAHSFIGRSAQRQAELRDAHFYLAAKPEALISSRFLLGLQS